MDAEPKYKIGDTIHYRVVKGDKYVSTAKILQILNTRVDGQWGYLYVLNKSGSLSVKENELFLDDSGLLWKK